MTLKHLRPWIAVVAFGLGVFLVYRALQKFDLDDIVASLRAISTHHVVLALLFTVGSFVALSGFDALAVRYTQRKLPYYKIALASFTSLSIGHTIGLAALSSGALRYRFYTAWGLSPGDVGRIIVFSGVTVALGVLTVSGLSSLVKPELLADLFAVDPAVIVAFGIVLLLAVGGYLVLAAFVHHPIRIRSFELPVPSLRLALAQTAVGAADFLLVAAVLHQMLSASADIDYVAIAAAYVTANVAGIATHVPGGLGVIEAVVMSLVPGAHVVGALIAFRALYYLLPFAIGCLTLVVAEIFRRHSAQHRGSIPLGAKSQPR